jgi:hypothetical protein
VTAHLRCDQCGVVASDVPLEVAYGQKGWTSAWPRRVIPSPLAVIVFGSQPDSKYALDLCPSCRARIFPPPFEEGAFGPPPGTHLHASFSLVEPTYQTLLLARGPSATLRLFRWAWIALMFLIAFWQLHMFFRWLETSLSATDEIVKTQEI